MASKRVSLKTIAQITGVSVPTVSQILNNKTANYSSEETRRRVIEASKELNYRPSFAYKLMQGKNTNTAAILASSSQLFYEEYLKNIFIELATCFEQQKWSIHTGILTTNIAQNLEVIHQMHQRGVEKVVLIGIPVGWKEITKTLDEYKIPYVGMAENAYSRAVLNGSTLAVQKIITYLKQTAGRQLKLVCPCDKNSSPEEISRYKALTAAYPELTSQECLSMTMFLPLLPLQSSDYSSAARKIGYEATQKILQEEPDIKAIVFLNDDFALGAGYYLMEHPQLQDKIKIAGYNNNANLANFPIPIITGGASPHIWASELINSISQEGDFIKTIPSQLYIREKDSTKKDYPFWNEKIISVEI